MKETQQVETRESCPSERPLPLACLVMLPRPNKNHPNGETSIAGAATQKFRFVNNRVVTGSSDTKDNKPGSTAC